MAFRPRVGVPVRLTAVVNVPVETVIGGLRIEKAGVVERDMAELSRLRPLKGSPFSYSYWPFLSARRDLL